MLIRGLCLRMSALLDVSRFGSSLRLFRSPIDPLLILPHLPDQPTPLADLLAPLVKHERDGNERDLEHAKQRPCPPRRQIPIHDWACKRQGPSDHTSDYSISRECRGRIYAIAARHVARGVYENDCITGPKWYTS